MTRFFGEVGYGNSVETSPGVFEETITEKQYYGDVLRNSRKLQDGQKVNDDISVQNSISVVADAFITENINKIRYVRWAGALWKVPDVEVQSPRIVLRLGGVYNGPTA